MTPKLFIINSGGSSSISSYLFIRAQYLLDLLNQTEIFIEGNKRDGF